MLRGLIKTCIPARLREACEGNVLAIVALVMPALLILIGGGLDMSRGYMARTSLQNACDAGVLAGRRAMNKSGTFGSAEQAKAKKMFDFNFQGSTVSASTATFTMSSTAQGEVLGTASTTVPTTLMKIFGQQQFALTITCGAELQMASADVMLVLDTTGSMACEPSGANCYSGSTSKIQGLRDAVREFYKTVAAAVIDKNATRVRFGFVPYSGTVNVKDLVSSGDFPTSYFTNSTSYQTKLAYFNTPTSVGTDGSPVVTTETYSSAIKSSDCDKYATNDYPFSGNNPVSSGTAPSDTSVTTYSYNSWTKTSGSGSKAVGTCIRNKSVVTTTYSTAYQFSYYRYIKSTVPTSSYKTLSPVTYVTSVSSSSTVPTAGTYDMVTLAGMSGVTGLSTSSDSWDGCIEERSTVVDLAMSTVPSGATDLDLTSAPSDDATRWKPYWGAMEVYRGNYMTSLDSSSNYGGSTEYCPSPMKKFTTVDVSDPTTVPSWLDTYLNNLVARGGTYHDVGMIWGGRLANPNGLMASNVNDDPSRQPSRHVIFLTDGIMDPSLTAYSAYGMEYYDSRIAPSGTSDASMASYHNSRFLAMCSAVKSMGYTIWMIGFGVTLTDEMKACASGGRAYASSDSASLKATFRYIASQVGELRINK